MLRRRPGSQHWHYDFSVNGYRFRGSCKTDIRETAEIIEAKLRSDILLGHLIHRKAEISLDAALGRYWLEVGHALDSAKDVKRMGERILERIPRGRSLAAPDWGSELASYITWRRGHDVQPATINRELELLRRVFRRALTLWKVSVEMPAWKELFLLEPEDRNVSMSRSQEEALFEALRPDFHPMVRFALASGLRVRNVLFLRWSQVDWDKQTITVRVKSKKPGKRELVLPITSAIAAILTSEKGRHEEFVFTYLCAKGMRDRWDNRYYGKGVRRPFSKNGWRHAFQEARDAAGMPNLRFHDLRHTFANRVLPRVGGNLKTLQRALGHADVSSTMRYIKSDLDDMRTAMEEATKPRPIAVPDVKNSSKAK